MLLQFAFNLGQETGLTALGTGGMIFFLLRWRETREMRLLVPAAVAAAVAACAREYGAVAALAGGGWIFSRGVRGARPLALHLVRPCCRSVWHARVYLLTGNPLYAQDFADWPTNPVFAAWMRNYRAIYGDALHHPATWLEIARIGLVTALPALLGLAGGLAWGRKQTGWGLGCALTAGFVAIWIWSVPFTAGGPFYSMRVLSPLLLLGFAAGGAFSPRARGAGARASWRSDRSGSPCSGRGRVAARAGRFLATLTPCRRRQLGPMRATRSNS